jgi:hypothetical protein
MGLPPKQPLTANPFSKASDLLPLSVRKCFGDGQKFGYVIAKLQILSEVTFKQSIS